LVVTEAMLSEWLQQLRYLLGIVLLVA